MEVTEEVLRNETGLIEVIFELIDRGVLLDEIDAARNNKPEPKTIHFSHGCTG